MDKYFDMRYKDFLIQSYTRYGLSGAADLDIVEEFNERNAQYFTDILETLEEIGIYHPSNSTQE